MIITRLTGGLGNQMFQYAAGLSLACLRRTTLKLDTSWFAETAGIKTHERYALDSFDLSEQIADPAEIARSRGLNPAPLKRHLLNRARSLRVYPLTRRLLAAGDTYYEDRLRFDPLFFKQSAHTYLHGNWQSEKFFLPAAGLLRARFIPKSPAPPEITALAGRIRSGPSAFLHVRRGDYVSDPVYARDIGALGAGYYTEAVRLLREKHPGVRVFIFSDDIAAAARDLGITGPHEFVHEPAGATPHHILHVMSLCDHAVIANSTFSWWAAWLGEKKQGLIIAPRRWFADGSPYNAADIVPGRWLQL